MEIDGDLFSGFEEPEATQPEATPYDKIIESRKSASFASEQIERVRADEIRAEVCSPVPAEITVSDHLVSMVVEHHLL